MVRGSVAKPEIPQPPAAVAAVLPPPPIPPERIPALLLEDDTDEVPTLSGPGRRYEQPHLPVPLTRPAPTAALEPDSGPGLEENYGIGRVWLAARDPHTLHVSWELTELQAAAGGDRVAVRVRSLSESGRAHQEVKVDEHQRSVFVRVDEPGGVYEAEVGFRDAAGAWHTLASGQPVNTPPQRGSMGAEPRFVRVVFEPPLAAESVVGSPQKSAETPSGEPAPAPTSPASPSGLSVPLAAERHPKRQSARETRPEPQTQAPEAVADSTTLPSGPAALTEAATVKSAPALRAAEARLLQPEPFPLSGAPGVVAPATYASAFSQAEQGPKLSEPARSSGSSPRDVGVVIHGPPASRPASGAWRAHLIDVAPPRLEARAAEALHDLVAISLREPEAPSSAEMVWSGQARPDRVAPTLARGPAEFDQPSSQAAIPSRPPGAGKRDFWFMVNAELIVYGATEPDAQVFIDGEAIPLRPDGTFTLRFALPDGAYGLSAVAMAAHGEASRSARLNFLRRTAYRGEVGRHPGDPALNPPPRTRDAARRRRSPTV